MSFEVNTGTAASALDGTEKIPVSQGGLPRVITTKRLAYYDGVAIRAEYSMRIDTGGSSSSLYIGNPTVSGGFAYLNYAPGGDQLTVQSNNGSIKNIASGNNYLSWSDASDDLFINLISSATFRNSGSLRIQDTDASHTLSIAVGSDLTNNRTLTLTTGNANRTLDISAGSVTISSFGASLVDDANAAAARTTLAAAPVTAPQFLVSSSSGTGVSAWTGGHVVVSTAATTTAKGLGFAVDTGSDLCTIYALQPNTAWLHIEYQALDHNFYQSGSLAATISGGGISVVGSVKPSSYTVATVPSASAHGAGAMIYVSDEAGGAVPAFSDGTNWKRVSDRNTIS